MLAAATVVILIFGPFIKRAGSSGHSREANSLPALRLAPFNFVLFWFCFVLFCFLLFFGHACCVWKFLGQELNPWHSSDNAGSLTH